MRLRHWLFLVFFVFLPRVYASQEDVYISLDESNDCPICLDSLSDNISDLVVLPCGHLFCNLCLKETIKSKKITDFSCPVCRGACEAKYKIKADKNLLSEVLIGNKNYISREDFENLLGKKLLIKKHFDHCWGYRDPLERITKSVCYCGVVVFLGCLTIYELCPLMNCST